MSQRGSAWRPTVHGYSVRGEVGRGGFAVVYEAEQEAIGRLVALKVITTPGVDAEVERRFRAECRTIGQVSWHPHIVDIYDAGRTEEGAPYLAMPLFTAGSLGDRLREKGRLTVQQALTFGLEVSDALAAAHEAGVIHRDVKPDNLMVGRRGEAVLADFGIATIAAITASVAGTFVGSLPYSAPELLAGARADASSDLYALGATIHALLTGHAPFVRDAEDTPAAIMFRVASNERAPLPADVPSEVVALVDRCMAADPSDRPASLETLHKEIGLLLNATDSESLTAELMDSTTVALGLPTPEHPFSAPTLRNHHSPRLPNVPPLPSHEIDTELSLSLADDLRWIAGRSDGIRDPARAPDPSPDLSGGVAPAPFFTRAAARLVDFAVSGFVAWLIFAVPVGGTYLPQELGALPLLLHPILTDIVWGRSAGKWAFGLRVVSVNGRGLRPAAVVVRSVLTVLLLVVLFSPARSLGFGVTVIGWSAILGGLITLVSIAIDTQHVGVLDRWAGTRIVRVARMRR